MTVLVLCPALRELPMPGRDGEGKDGRAGDWSGAGADLKVQCSWGGQALFILRGLMSGD